MDTALRILTLYVFSFVILEILTIVMPRFPKFPWDIYLRKPGFSIYLPVITALGVSVILSFLLNFYGFGK